MSAEDAKFMAAVKKFRHVGDAKAYAFVQERLNAAKSSADPDEWNRLVRLTRS